MQYNAPSERACTLGHARTCRSARVGPSVAATRVGDRIGALRVRLHASIHATRRRYHRHYAYIIP
eukprot:3252309-Rhodomonas_salina.1